MFIVCLLISILKINKEIIPLKSLDLNAKLIRTKIPKQNTFKRPKNASKEKEETFFVTYKHFKLRNEISTMQISLGSCRHGKLTKRESRKWTSQTRNNRTSPTLCRFSLIIYFLKRLASPNFI